MHHQRVVVDELAEHPDAVLESLLHGRVEVHAVALVVLGLLERGVVGGDPPGGRESGIEPVVGVGAVDPF